MAFAPQNSLESSNPKSEFLRKPFLMLPFVGMKELT
jgi:hypothetical protein